MSFIRVKNKRGTADKSPPASYTSWLDFWEKKKEVKATVCEVFRCNASPDVGGHIIKCGEESTEYILPMCYSCNNKQDGEVFEAWEADLVSILDMT